MLTRRQNKALQALLTQPTKGEAAKAAGIASRTLYDYLRDPEFQAEYKRQSRELVTDAAHQAKQALSPALTTLRTIAENPGARDADKNVAARSLLEFGLRLTEISDILAELDEDDRGD